MGPQITQLIDDLAAAFRVKSESSFLAWSTPIASRHPTA